MKRIILLSCCVLIGIGTLLAIFLYFQPRLTQKEAIPDIDLSTPSPCPQAVSHATPRARRPKPSRPPAVNRSPDEVGPGPALSPAIQAALKHFADTSVPIKTRIEEIETLGRSKDPAARATLMALGNARLYANRYAVDALGHQRGDDVTGYLTEKLSNKDALILCAAIRALARSTGKASIPALSRVFTDNRTRHDGHEDMVCTAAAVTLGRIGDASAVPPLVAELNRSEEMGWDMEYGSVLVKALRSISVPGIRAPLNAYADRLAARIPDDPMAKKHFETKIAEARAAAGD